MAVCGLLGSGLFGFGVCRLAGCGFGLGLVGWYVGGIVSVSFDLGWCSCYLM